MSSIFSTIKVGSLTFISRILGLIRDIATTNLLGASIFHDVFVVVIKIPNMFRRLFAEGAFSLAFIPIYKSLVSNNKESEAIEFTDSLLGLMLICLFIFTVLALAFAPIFIFFFAPGYYFDSEVRVLAVDVLRIMFPYLALMSLVAFAAGIQNSKNYFSVPAATPIIFNVVLILSAVFFSRYFDVPLFALAWGVLISGILQLLIQIFPLKLIGFLPRPSLNFNNKYLKKFGLAILPAILAGGVSQLNLLVDTIYASFLIEGSPTWLYVSERVMQLPIGVVAVAIGTVLLPSLSNHYSSKNIIQFKHTLLQSTKLVIFVGLPCTLGLLFFGSEILTMLFLRGAFTYEDVLMANESLKMFAIGIPFFMLMKVLVPCFFALERERIPLYIAIIGLLSNVILNYFFAFYLGFGHYGLALGSSLSAMIGVIIFLSILGLNKYFSINLSFIIFLIRVSLSTFLMSAFLIYLVSFVDFGLFTGFTYIFVIFSIIFASILIFLSSAFLFGIKKSDFL